MTELDIKSLSFEQALKALDDILRALEAGDTPLESSIKSYEQGTALKAHCEEKLKEAQAKIEKIIIKQDGTIETEPFGDMDAPF